MSHCMSTAWSWIGSYLRGFTFSDKIMIEKSWMLNSFWGWCLYIFLWFAFLHKSQNLVIRCYVYYLIAAKCWNHANDKDTSVGIKDSKPLLPIILFPFLHHITILSLHFIFLQDNAQAVLAVHWYDFKMDT
jgi:hypothetical protein